MNQTQKQIFEAAQQCFFQYGYTKTSLKMVSDLSGLSRVTIYKHFTNKENLFREVINATLKNSAAEAEQSLRHEADYWVKLEILINAWLVSPLESIASDMVINDLRHASKQIGEDFLDKWKKVLQDNLDAITRAAVETGQIEPAKLGMNAERVSEVIGIMISGLSNLNIQELRQGAAQSILFLQAALRP